MNSLVIYRDDGTSVTIPVANGFVSRVVGWIASENIPDAIRVAGILNAESAAYESAALHGRWWEADASTVLLQHSGGEK